MLILQRYEFSSKSQQHSIIQRFIVCCCWYYKGTNFQANHNTKDSFLGFHLVVADTTKVRIFKQITTPQPEDGLIVGCCWYYKGTNFQANHNMLPALRLQEQVVADTTKVRIFKQITTKIGNLPIVIKLLLILQRYEFSSKSQHSWLWIANG